MSTGRGNGEKLTLEQRAALDSWVAYLYKQGYTGGQVAAAIKLSPSTVSNSLARLGIKTRGGIGRLPDLEEGKYAMEFRRVQYPPGEVMAQGRLNQGGLLTTALVHWKSKNALSALANRVEAASPAELGDAAVSLEETIRYAQNMIRVLDFPDFAKEVRTDPRYRDDVGHRFTGRLLRE